MTISDYLLSNWDLLLGYFTESNMEDWKNDYEIKAKNIGHDEPWLTLVAARSLFGAKSDLKEKNRVSAFNTLIQSSGMEDPPELDEIIDLQLEKQLPEILSYKETLKKVAFHYFPQTIKTIEDKRKKENASFEGPTHVDLFIIGRTGSINICFVIEAKFNSDISKDITYNPVRDQIIRNIDAAIDITLNQNLPILIHSFCFLLLTPKIFRTAEYGGNKKTDIEIFQPQRGRFYCYKMDEYRKSDNIRLALPHRHGGQEPDWEQISKRIGWITFEDIYQTALTYRTIDPVEYEMIREFMQERNMMKG